MSTMGCRTANLADINAEPGVNPQMKDGRGNICPVTIILPTLAMEADRDVDAISAATKNYYDVWYKITDRVNQEAVKNGPIDKTEPEGVTEDPKPEN